MFLANSNQFLINANVIDPNPDLTTNNSKFKLEFIFDTELYLLGTVRLFPATAYQQARVEPINNLADIYRVLFGLNHIRVNPKLDNHQTISIITDALTAAGIRINNPPVPNSLAICFQPLGEIQDQVRFYLKENNQVVFLSTNKPKLRIVQ